MIHVFGKAIFISAIFAFVSCSPGDLSKIDVQKLFDETQQAVQEHYLEPPESNTTSLAEMYAAAGAAVQSKERVQNAKELAAILKKKPGSEKRGFTYRALRAFLETLPAGESDFLRPETLRWSNDPDRTAGIGMVIHRIKHGEYMALDTLEGSASHREKIPPGMILRKVDDVSVSDMDLEEVIGRIKGPPDTEVKLDFGSNRYTLVRGATVFRNILNAPWEISDEESAEYIQLRSTLPGTAEQLRALILRLLPRKALILDLRKMHTGDYRESFMTAVNFVSEGGLGKLRIRGAPDQEFTALDRRIFDGKIYVILGTKSSAFAHTLAMAMSVSPDVVLCGKVGEIRTFLAKQIPVEGGIELRLTAGTIVHPKGKPLHETGLRIDLPLEDSLPEYPPLKQPDPADPAQAKLAELLNVRTGKTE